MGKRRINRVSKKAKKSKKAVAVEKELIASQLEDKLQEIQTEVDENQDDDNDILNVDGELNGVGEQNGEGEVNGEGEQNGQGEVNGEGEQNGQGDVNGEGEQNGQGDVNGEGEQNGEEEVNGEGELNGEEESGKEDDEHNGEEESGKEDDEHKGEAEPGNEDNDLNGEEEPGNEDDEHMKDTLDHEVQTQKETVDHEPKRKRIRGPTRMKHIAKDPNERQHVDFTLLGEPCGPGSVLLSSYLGPLVREHVPVIIQDWKKVSEDIKTVLWKSILARFDVDEGYKKTAVFTQMNSLWRASKSRLVTKVREASTLKERMSLQPKNVSTSEWRKFVKEKTSNAFKVVSDSYKERRQKQIPHTCGRKGMVRLREELVKNSTEPSKVTRLKVWVKSRTRKDGTPVNVNAAEKIKLAAELDSEGPQDSTTTNPKADMLTQILGPDNPGRLRAMGRGMSLTKLSFLELNNNCMAAMEEKQIHLQKQVENLQQVIAKMNNQQREEPDVGENSINKSVNTRSLPKCLLVDWCSTDETVAEGRVVSYDPDEIVNGIPLGPNSVKVLVESAIKPEAFLWRPAHEMFTVEDAVGEMVAWQVDYCIVPTAGFIPEDIAPKSPSTSSKNRCELMDYIKNDEVVAEGRWQSQEPKALVNGLPLGPNAMKIYVDKVLNPTAYIWRPTVDMRTMEDSLNHFVAWPANRVVIDTTTPTPSTSKAVSRSSQNKNSPVTPEAPLKKPAAPVKKPAAPFKKPAPSLKASSPFKKPAASLKASSPLKKPAASLKASSPRRTSQRLAFKENQKCKLLDLSGNKRVVAEGRWSSNNPDQVVHFVPLGPGACRVWVDVVKVLDAAVWRKSSGIEYMEDAIGSVLAWPADKVVME